ncbi:MAG: ATP-binding protein, partial [Rhodopirellula sp. JB053]
MRSPPFLPDVESACDLDASRHIRLASTLAWLLLVCAGRLSIAADSSLEHGPYRGTPQRLLEERLAKIDRSLQLLARPSMRSGVGAIGYRSTASDNPHQTVDITIRLAEEAAIDQVVLVPAIWRDTTLGFRADGFPVAFNISVGCDDDQGHRVANFTSDDKLLPRIAPVVVNIEPRNATWIRIEATQLSQRAWDNRYVLQLSEILVFSGRENVALHQRVESSSSDEWEQGPRKRKYLVDGFMPYLMNGVGGEQSTAFVSRVEGDVLPTLSVDLGSTYEVERIYFHSTDQSDTIPASAPEGFGFPGRILVEGSLHEDFTDPVTLLDYVRESEFDTGPIVMRHCVKTSCRYVRMKLENLPTHRGYNQETEIVGFAEIEIFSDGINVA